MTKILAVANQKGGVGKTTTAVNTSAVLSGSGRKVLLVDLDPQANATMGSGIDKHKLENSIYELLIGTEEINSVLKKTRFGYDGFGVKILKSKSDIQDLPDCEMIIEDFVHFKKELAVIVARNLNGDIKTYETVEMEFNSDSNQVEFVISPSRISDELKLRAKEIAIETTKKIDNIGLLAVEMFLTENDEILINEVAPRPHNSGHFTIEACPTSQFEQHLRSILNLPLGNTAHKNFAIMLNLVGDNGFDGNVFYENLESAYNEINTHVHIYGKEKTRPNRKMGHITIICDKFEDAYNKAVYIKSKIKVKTL